VVALSDLTGSDVTGSDVTGSDVIAIIGPTASGKTALAVALALRLDAEIVNADALACYRRMDIGTAKPTLAERRGVVHHCLDLWEPSVEAGVALWRAAATQAITQLQAAGRAVVIVGGSGLYVRALLEGWELPGTDPALRAELEAQLAEHGPGVLHQRLAQVDPAAAVEILPGNGRRIVRALEVHTLTGRPFQARLPKPAQLCWGARIIGLDPPLATVDARVDARVEAMFVAGLVAETAAIRSDPGFGRTAARALGYAQVLAHLEGGLSLEQARADTARVTRRFVRRQRSWWRSDPRVRWLSTTYAPDGSLGPVDHLIE
jgi:tRNA dimethylallyltransferase